ncbi:SCO2400 family protein [Actinacidiphila glaucinigra]|uniref:SCO2400 family protein n=1 Tax=Actinacidiphila glaucinigra TaxID=235986 RepID=UPI0040592AEF
MDYCSSCRRHLNGALVCPGCGAYAPDIAPPMWQGPDSAAERERLRDVDDPDDPDGTRQDDADPSLQGRAARRRQLERWKKNRRRAAAATAVALVGGGLTVAALPHGGSRGQADTAAAAEPLTPATSRTLPLSSIPAQPGDSAHRPGERTHPTTAAPRGDAPRAAPSTASTTAPARTAPQGETGSRVRAVTAAPTPADTAPHTDAPSSAPQPPADVPATPPTTTATPTPSATKSPMQLCLLVLCLG